MRRAWLLAGLVLVLVVGVVAWRLTGDDDWDPDAQFAPSLRPAFGARVDGDRLVFTTGAPCVGVTSARVTFDPASDDAVVLDFTAPDITVTTFDPTGADGVLTPVDPVPADFDWRRHESATFVLDGPDVSRGSPVDLREVVAGSADHDPDTYWFQDVGWLDPDQVAAEDGTSFLTTCTPDPADAAGE